MTPYNFMDPKTVADFGILQEVNRLFFHPLGLALVIEYPTEEGEEARILGIAQDDDPEGWAFDDLSTTEARLNKERVDEIRRKFSKRRKVLFGSEIQPIGSTLGPLIDGERD